MAITRWDPFADIFNIDNQLAKFFSPRNARGYDNWVPAVDLYEKDGELKIRAELAGVKPEDIDISVENGLLTIKGEKKFSEEVKEENLYKVEQRYGSFQRTISLPSDVVSDDIGAEFGDGVLEITIPRKDKPAAKKVKIQSKK